MNQNELQGGVMVIGGGIAGIQAALSLSSAGYGVYLVERAASLGGTMSTLHRVYPLCACCKLDPRIAACRQDPNIRVFLDTRVTDISGEGGNFTVSIKSGEQESTLKAGAIILAAGLETFQPSNLDTYAYGHFPNVVTSVEYEEYQKPLGPGRGILKRPADGKIPEKVAWLQCVGSRDISHCDAPYCSAVCCMYALKEAVNTKDFREDIETTVFFMDMRTHGKGFEEYLNTAVSRGVRLLRSRVHTVDHVPGTTDLLLTYTDESGHMHSEVYDMVVLSVGLKPSAEAVELGEKIGLKIDEDHYIGTAPFTPVSTNIPGIFVCGGMSGPHDIGQSITQASACVSEIASFFKPEPFSPPKIYPERSPEREANPHVLVAYHVCSSLEPALARSIDEYAEKLPGVSAVLKVEGDILQTLTGKLAATDANRLVFASCTPVIHKSLLEEALRRAGLNPFLYETVDLRTIDPKTALGQLKDRIRTGVARAVFLSPPALNEIPVVKHALVVGGGVSGMESALAISKAGFPATIVEKERELGGHGRHVRCTWQGGDAQAYFKKLTASIANDKNITVMTETTVIANKGAPGNFTTTVRRNGRNINLAHGVTILATGADPIVPEEYLYGRHKNIYNWHELSSKMIEDASALAKADSAVFIQCVGSRDAQRPHCSNLCCSFAVRAALDLKAMNPDMDIYILYREVRTFGKREDLYQEARRKGVIFIRYDLDSKPTVQSREGDDRLDVTVFDPILGRPIVIQAGFVSLQSAIVGTNNRQVADLFRVSLDRDGFFAESPQKLKPLDSSSEGVYLAGLALYPKDTGESITQAKAAAALSLEILSRDTIQVGGVVAEVIREKCAACCTCVRACPFGVPIIDRQTGAADIDPGLCQGCGICVSECPAKAIAMAVCSDEMLTRAPSILMSQA